MACYTMTLCDLVKMKYNLALNNYPIFDEKYREILNQKIIDHFYYYEIGAETPDRFNRYLSTKMQEIMPYYNKLYETETMKFDPLTTELYVMSELEKISGNSSTNLTSNNTKEDSGSDTRTIDGNNVLYGTVKDTGTETGATEYNTKKDFNNKENTTTTFDNQVSLSKDTTESNTGTTETETVNNLNTTVHTETSGSGTNDTHGSKSEAYSETPQTKVNATMTAKANGDIDVDISGQYLTTFKVDSTIQNDKTTTTQNSDSESANTGTVDTTNTLNTTTSTTGTDTTTKTGSDTLEKIGSSDETKTGTDTNTVTKNLETSTNNKETENTTDSIKYGKTENYIANQDTVTNKTEDNNKDIQMNGRRGTSPSALIIEYRQSIINIDMMIIDELYTLFMGVF